MPPMNWYNLLPVIIGSLITGGALVYALKWIRFRKMDPLVIAEKKAQIEKLEIENEIAISKEYLNWIGTLKDELNRIIAKMNSIQVELENERKVSQEYQRKNMILQKELEQERETCRKFITELEQIKLKLQVYERKSHRP